MRILFVTTRYPWPPYRGNQLRTAQWIEWLTSRHQVTLVTPRPSRGAVAPPAMPNLTIQPLRRRVPESAWQLLRALAGRQPLQAGLYSSGELRRQLPGLLNRHDVAIAQLVRLVTHLDGFGDTPLLADLVDSLSLNFERWAQFEDMWRAAALRWEARRLDRAEQRFIARAERSVVVCDRDRADLVGRLGTRAAQRLTVLPLAVPPGNPEPRAAGGPPLIVLSGNLGYFPTVDGMCWWLDHVWPEARRRFAGARVLLAGARPSLALRRSARQAGAEIEESPADLRAILRRATVAIAPARCGSGVPIKILEAWAEGAPVAATRWSAAGTTGVEGRDLLVADTAAEWLTALGDLLGSNALRERLATGGRQRLREDYGEEQLRQRLEDLVEETVARSE